MNVLRPLGPCPACLGVRSPSHTDCTQTHNRSSYYRIYRQCEAVQAALVHVAGMAQLSVGHSYLELIQAAWQQGQRRRHLLGVGSQRAYSCRPQLFIE